MKRLNPATGTKFKKGDVREDGNLFWAYSNKLKTNKFFIEVWLKPESFKKVNQSSTAAALKCYKENPNAHNKRVANWAYRNKNKRNASEAKRKTAKKQRLLPWLTQEHFEQIEEFYTIAKMFQMYTGQEYHVDHIVPLQGKNVSGFHAPWNLQILTAKENLSKGNR